MLFPGPAMASAFSVPSARLGARVGYRIPGLVGALMFACGSVWWITHVGNNPAYFSDYLPGMLVGGAGVGLVIPTLTGAGASSLAPERFATGAAVLTMARQIGSALGIAVLVAVLGSDATSASDFHTAWLISATGALATASCSSRSARPPGWFGARPRRPRCRQSASAGDRGARDMNVSQAARTRSFSWEDPAAMAAAAQRLTGLEVISGVIDGTLPRPPVAQMLGFEM